MDSTVDWTQVKKELMNLKKCQWKLPKLKLKEEKKRKKQNRIFKNCGTILKI